MLVLMNEGKKKFKNLTDAQNDCLLTWILMRTNVFDLGCGSHILFKFLDQYSMSNRIIGVDKEYFPNLTKKEQNKYLFIESNFSNLNESLIRKPLILQSGVVDSVVNAVISYPVNYEISYGTLFNTIQDFIYIGTNTRGTVCGGNTFWKQVLNNYTSAEYVPGRNTLIVYKRTDNRTENHKMYYEEFCGLVNTVLLEVMPFSDRMDKHTPNEWIRLLGFST